MDMSTTQGCRNPRYLAVRLQRTPIMSARITRCAHCWKCTYWPILCPARRQSRQPPWPTGSAGMTHPRAAASGQGGCVLAVFFPRTVGVAGSET
jgi:hypothetical protein